jgi:hypothetical protein
MSLQAAMDFIRIAREDDALRARIGESDEEASLEAIAEIGAQAGFAFSAEELRSAFKHDWNMRWAHFGSRVEGSGR